MIRINLLPPEARARTGTPTPRFAAFLIGLTLVLSSAGYFAYTHLIELRQVKDVKASRQAEANVKERQKARSLALQREVDMYEKRREAIRTINRSRTLWSRKLDQFFDIVTGHGVEGNYLAWLGQVELPTQLAPRRRAGRAVKGAPVPAGELRVSGYLAMESDTEAPAFLSSFHKSLTGDPENTGQPTRFFDDFMSISNPNIEMIATPSQRAEGPALIPPMVGAFRYELALKPVDLSDRVRPRTPPAVQQGGRLVSPQ